MKEKINSYVKLFQKILFMLILFLLISRDRSNSREQLMLLFGVSVILKKIYYKEKWKSITKPIKYSLIGYLIFLMISYFKIPEISRSFPHLKIIIFYYIFFPFFVYQIDFQKKDYKKILGITMLASIIVIIRGWYFIEDTPNFFKSFPRLELWGFVATASGVIIAMYILINIIICCCIKNIFVRIIGGVIILGQLIMMILCQTRSVFLFLPFTLFILFLLVNYKNKILKKIDKRWYSLFILTVPLYLGIKKYLPNFYYRLSLKKMLHNERFLVYKHGIDSLEWKNLLLGKGFFYNGGAKAKISKSLAVSEYHNIYLEVLVTQGLFALISLISFIFFIGKELIIRYLNESDNIKKCINLIALGLLGLFCIIGFLESTIYMLHLGRIVFLYSALALGIRKES